MIEMTSDAASNAEMHVTSYISICAYPAIHKRLSLLMGPYHIVHCDVFKFCNFPPFVGPIVISDGSTMGCHCIVSKEPL